MGWMGNNKSNFCLQAKQILCEMGQQNVYRRLEHVNIDQMKKLVFEKEVLNWSENVNNFSKLDLLSKIKPSFGTESLERYDKSLLSQFRYDILPIEVETGRYKGPNSQDGKCTLCNTGEIEDQFHFALYYPINYAIRTDFVAI